MNEKTILCFGSETEGDTLALDICDSLKGKIPGKNLVKCKNPFELAEYLEKEDVVILDVVKGIKKPMVFDSVDEFKKTQTVTVHDLDLGFFINILENMKDSSFKIIGVPFGKKIGEVLEDVRNLISLI